MRDLPRRTVTALVYAGVVLVAVVAPPAVFWAVLAAAGVLGLRELAALWRGWPSLLLGAVFVAGLACLGLLRQLGSAGSHHAVAGELPVWLFLAVVPTWAADVAAYVVGSAYGRRRIAPRVSPGKTWEGTLAGFAACALAAFGVAATFGLGRPQAAVVAAALGPLGFAGDLLESWVKRRAGVKDSGTLLPGHGGILDRLDSLVAGAILVLIVAASVVG